VYNAAKFITEFIPLCQSWVYNQNVFCIFLGGVKFGESGGLVSPHRETRGSGGSVSEGSQVGARRRGYKFKFKETSEFEDDSGRKETVTKKMRKKQFQDSSSDLASKKHDIGRARVTRCLVFSVEITFSCYLLAISFQ
jgi:hypothetical protein